MDKFYIRQNNKTFGPFTVAQIRDAAQRNRISPNARYRSIDSSDWYPVQGLLRVARESKHQSIPPPLEGGSPVDDISGWIEKTKNLPAINKSSAAVETEPSVSFDASIFMKLLHPAVIVGLITILVGMVSLVALRYSFPRLATAAVLAIIMLGIAHVAFLAMRLLADYPMAAVYIGIGLVVTNGSPVFMWIVNSLVDGGFLPAEARVPEVVFWFLGLFHFLIAYQIIAKYVLNEEVSLAMCTVTYGAAEFIIMIVTSLMASKTTVLVSRWLIAPYDTVF